MIEVYKVQNQKKSIKLERFLAQIFKGISRSISKVLIRESLILVKGKNVKTYTKVRNGDEISYNLDSIRKFLLENKLIEIGPVEMDLTIISEDENVIVIDKPSGIVVYPSTGHKEDSLLNGVVHHVISNLPNPFSEIRPIHRLDKDTSGVIIFSKNLEIHQRLTRAFRKREVRKEYLAVVSGDFRKYLRGDEFLEVKNYISKKPSDRQYFEVAKGEGEYAETKIYFEKYQGSKNQHSLLRVVPKTGRTHQIRVHLSQLGFPILGDKIYEGKKWSRLMLHAKEINFKSTEVSYKFSCESNDFV